MVWYARAEWGAVSYGVQFAVVFGVFEAFVVSEAFGVYEEALVEEKTKWVFAYVCLPTRVQAMVAE